MKGLCGSSVPVDPGYFLSAMPVPAPLKLERGFLPTGPPFLPHPGGMPFPFLMPRPFMPFKPFQFPPLPPHLTPSVPNSMGSGMQHVPRRREHHHHTTKPRAKLPVDEDTPVLDLSVKRPRLQDRERDMCDISDEKVMVSDQEDCTGQEQGLDLSSPDKQNTGKTFKKALLNRYHSKFSTFDFL